MNVAKHPLFRFLSNSCILGSHEITNCNFLATLDSGVTRRFPVYVSYLCRRRRRDMPGCAGCIDSVRPVLGASAKVIQVTSTIAATRFRQKQRSQMQLTVHLLKPVHGM